MNAKECILAGIAPVEEALRRAGEDPAMFRQCFMNTLDTTLTQQQDGTSFVITGDIPAMWLRDSTAQVMHYVRFADKPAVAALIEGLIERQMRYILLDPYANAFNLEASGAKWSEDRPAQSPWVWERKYEIDSLCHPVQLAHAYYTCHPTPAIFTSAFRQGLHRIVEIFAAEQRHEASPYWFERDDCPPSDTLPNGGKGTPVAYTGMTWSGFRPSDDACRYGYLIPANLFACVTLRRIAAFARVMDDEALAGQAEQLHEQIERGIQAYGLVEHVNHGLIYAYETDGMGRYTLMDDANVPSLLSLPYLGVCDKDDALYRRTRSFVLSMDNRYYYEGPYASGVGSPHTPAGYIWPIALCMQALTSTDQKEITDLVRMLLSTHGGTGFMHESFDPANPTQYTRAWFAWANSLFGELMVSLYEQGILETVVREARAERS